MVYCGLAITGSLTFELFVKREDCSLRGAVDVASATASRGELGAGLRELCAEEGGRTMSIDCVSGCGSLEGVACSSTSGVHVDTSVWVRLGDLVGRHCERVCVVSVCWGLGFEGKYK